MAKTKNSYTHLPSSGDVQKFDMLYPMLVGDLAEVRELSKKKQDEPLNAFKVKTINKKLGQIKDILKNEPTSEFLELLDEDSLPSNSDAVLLIVQFKSAMEQFKERYYTVDETGLSIGSWETPYSSWKTKD